MAFGNYGADDYEEQGEFAPHPVTGDLIPVRRTFIYKSLKTLRLFHKCTAKNRAIVGPVGSGKTAGVSVEIGYRIPLVFWNRYGLTRTRWIVVRNTYPMLIDSTQRTFFEWFPPGMYGHYHKQEKLYEMSYTTLDKNDEPCTLSLEILFRSCDRPEEVDKFRGYELTGYYIDEADEVHEDIKKVLKQRVGRYPPMSTWYRVLRKKYPKLRNLSIDQLRHEIESHPEVYQTAFGIETSNPPSTESNLYWTFDWHEPPPGPKPSKKPLQGHVGFWQPPRENVENLRPGYYEQMEEDYAYAKDWVERYIEGKPGIRLKGKNVYNNFSRKFHEAAKSLVWSGDVIYRGWDNTGLHPACIIAQSPVSRQIQVLKEFWGERENIVLFTKRVIDFCNKAYPNATYIDYADPAGWNQHSTKDGSLTSNSEMMIEECGIELEKSEQNFTVRVNSVDSLLMEMAVPGEPCLLVDPDCVGLINGFMGGYFFPRVAQSSAGEEVYSEKPVKNKYADLHDAFQYIAAMLRSASPKRFLRGGSSKYGRPDDPLLIS